MKHFVGLPKTSMGWHPRTGGGQWLTIRTAVNEKDRG